MKGLRCQVCCKETSYEFHEASMSTRSSLDKKTYDGVEKQLGLNSRKASEGEVDSSGNAVVCPGCLHDAIAKARSKKGP